MRLAGYKFALSPAFRDALLNPKSPERVLVTNKDLNKWLRENICAIGINPLRTSILNDHKLIWDSTDESINHPWGFTLDQTSGTYYIDFLPPQPASQPVEAGRPALLIKNDILIIGTGLTANDQMDFFGLEADYYVSKQDLPGIFNAIIRQRQDIFGIGPVKALLIDEGTPAISSFWERSNDESSGKQIPQSRSIEMAMSKIRSYSSTLNLVIAGGEIGREITEKIRQGILLTSR